MASELEVGGLTVSGSGHDAATISVTNAGSNNARLLLNSGHGNWSVCNSDPVGDALEFRDETANATRLAIDSSGRVGVSVTPGAKLHVSSGTTNNLGDDVSEVRFIGPDKAITGEQANVVIQTNDDFAVDKGGSIGLGGRHTTSSTNGANFAQISGRKENATTANFAGYLAFSTSDAASDIHERMRIDASGNLTLGTPAAGSAAAQFHISGAAPRIRLEDTSAPANYSQIAADNGQLTLAADGGQGQASSAIIAQVDGSERMRIDGAGLLSVTGGIKNEQGIYGGQITIADDAVGTITPPRQGVMMAISYGNDSAYPAHQNMAGLIWCDTGSSLTCAKMTSEGSSISVHSAVDLSAGGETASVDERINISTVAGTIQLKNRIGSSVTWWYNFIA